MGSTGDGARERACPPAASTTKVSDRQQDKMPSQSVSRPLVLIESEALLLIVALWVGAGDCGYGSFTLKKPRRHDFESEVGQGFMFGAFVRNALGPAPLCVWYPGLRSTDDASSIHHNVQRSSSFCRASLAQSRRLRWGLVGLRRRRRGGRGRLWIATAVHSQGPAQSQSQSPRARRAATAAIAKAARTKPVRRRPFGHANFRLLPAHRDPRLGPERRFRPGLRRVSRGRRRRC